MENFFEILIFAPQGLFEIPLRGIIKKMRGQISTLFYHRF